MKLTNLQVTTILQKISQSFFNDEVKNKYLPIKLNFAIQKNLATLGQHNMAIESGKKTICEEYGIRDGDKYIFDNDKVDIANQELQDLYSVETDLPISTVSLNAIENIELTPAQMDAIMFMIEE